MINITNKVNCTGCEVCYSICPTNSIEMVEDETGHRYPKVDKSKCIKCGLCIKKCPMNNIVKNLKEESKVYAAINKNSKELKNSTSGGVFIQLAKYIIEQNGVVFGVKYDKNENAIYDYAETIDEIKSFSGSKYVQAKTKKIYIKVREFLETKRLVLFSGTPCQIAGLKNFLGKNYDNLYTCDIVCEGIPSDKILNAYKNHYEKKYKSKIVDIKFRDKKYGWKYSSMSLIFENGKKLYIPRTECSYSYLFYNLKTIRPSCTSCPFRKLNSGSDIKLADFWEVRDSKNGVYNYYGVSHICVNTEKGLSLFKNIEKNFDIRLSSLDEIQKLNNSFCEQKFDLKQQNEFMNNIIDKSDEEIYEYMNSFLDNSKIKKILFRIKLILVKFKYTILKWK